MTIAAARFSNDIDIFHDREERVARAVAKDAETLASSGYAVEWLRREFTFYSALVRAGGEATKLEWVVDSDFRFFPTVRDDLFGYVLHPVDLATNKIMAAAGRREPRDVIDLVMIHERTLPLGAVVWAAVEVAWLHARGVYQRGPARGEVYGRGFPSRGERSAGGPGGGHDPVSAGLGGRRDLCPADAFGEGRAFVFKRRRGSPARS